MGEQAHQLCKLTVAGVDCLNAATLSDMEVLNDLAQSAPTNQLAQPLR
jgi:hypothetical protein